MKLMEYAFPTGTRAYEFRLYPIGDLHMGASNCAEDKLSRLVSRIAADPNAYWISGGDLPDAVIINDTTVFIVDVSMGIPFGMKATTDITRKIFWKASNTSLRLMS